MANKIFKLIFGFLLVLSLIPIAIAADPTIDAKYPDADTVNIAEGDSQIFNITASDADGDPLTYSWTFDGEEVSTTNEYSYTALYNHSGEHVLTVNVNDATTTVSNSWNITVTNTNRAPVLDTINDQTIKAGVSYSFTVTASDEDIVYGDSLTYSVNISALTVTKIDDTSARISWTPTNDNAGTNSVEVTVSDSFGGTDSKTFTLTVEESKLVISDLDIEVDDEKDKNVENGETISKDAKPGSIVKLNIEVKNEYDFNLENVKVEATLRNIGEDSDNIEEESDEFDLDDGDKEEVSLEFDVPLKVEDKEYTITIDVIGEDKNNTRHRTEWTVYLNVEKEKHSVVINRLNLNPTTIRCEDTASLDFEVTNIGRESEDEVVVEIRSSELGISVKRTEIKLDEDIDDEDNDYRDTISFAIPSELEEGIYPITVKAYYDSDRQTDSKTVNLVKEVCTIPSLSPDAGEVEVIKTPSQQAQPVTQKATSSFAYMVFLVILALVALFLVIFEISYLARR